MKKLKREYTPMETLQQFENKAKELKQQNEVNNKIDSKSNIECNDRIQYVVVPWKEEDDLNLSPFLSYREAVAAGNEYYPEGYDIQEHDSNDYEWFDDGPKDVTSSIDPSDRVDPKDVADYADTVDPIDDWYDDDDASNWELLDRKDVKDSDDFWTKYSLYHNIVTDQYVAVFGDPDYYRPEDGDYDAEFDSEEEAYEWFEDYPEDPFGED